MSLGLTNEQYYSDIANAIREVNKTSNLYKPEEMAAAIKTLSLTSDFNINSIDITNDSYSTMINFLLDDGTEEKINIIYDHNGDPAALVLNNKDVLINWSVN